MNEGKISFISQSVLMCVCKCSRGPTAAPPPNPISTNNKLSQTFLQMHVWLSSVNVSFGVDEHFPRPSACDSLTVLHIGNIRRLKSKLCPFHTHRHTVYSTNECKLIIISNNTGWTCDLPSHLIGLPGQVGVPGDSNNLYDGQPARRRKSDVFDLDAVHHRVWQFNREGQ